MAELDPEDGVEAGGLEIEPFVVGVPGNPGADVGNPGDVLTYLGPNFVPRFRPVTGAGLGNTSGPGSTTVDFVPQWNNTTGTLLKNGLPVSTTGAALSLVETDSGGKIAASVIPLTGVTAGTYNSANITVLADGRLSAASPGAAAGIGDAPPGPTVYGRNAGAWLPVLPLSGGTMTGPITLVSPVAPGDAASKGYVDSTVAGLAPLVSPNFSGVPTAPNQIATDDSTRLATTHFVKMQGYTGTNSPITLTGDVAGGPAATTIPTTLATVNSTVGIYQGLTLDGKGRVTNAVNQNYLTAATAAFVPLAGGTISGTAPGSLVINRNTVTPVPIAVNMPLWMIAADSDVAPAFGLDGFATSGITMVFRRANNTASAPTRLIAGDGIGQIGWRGYYSGATSGYSAGVARITGSALEDFTDVGRGARIDISANPIGGTVPVTVASFGPGLTVGAPAGGDQGAGTVNARSIYIDGVPITPGGPLPYVPTAGGTISGTSPGSLTINRNTAAPPAMPAGGTALAVNFADADTAPHIIFDGHNGTGVAMVLRQAHGTGASPSPTLIGDNIGSYGFRGFDPAGYTISVGRVYLEALESFTTTGHGTALKFATVPTTLTGLALQVTVGPGLTVGVPTPPTGGMQVGDVNASRMLLNGVPITSVGGGGSGPITLTGDVIGSGTGTVASTVARMQGYPISTAAPLAGQVLGWNSSSAQWEPTAAVTGSGGPPGGAVGSVQINTSGAFGGIVMTGDASWNTTTTALTLNPSVLSTPGIFQGLTVNGKGLVTAATNMNYVTGGPYLPTAGGTIGGTAPGQLIINRNAVLPVAPAGATLPLWLIAADADPNPAVLIDSFQGGHAFVLRRANNTAASPTRTLNNDNLGQYAWRGYFSGTGSGYTLGVSRISAVALQDFTDTNQGTRLQFWTTPLNSIAPGMAMTIGPGVVVGSPASGDMGAGSLNAQSLYINGALVTAGPGGGTPGGSANQVQYNTGAAFGGSPGILLNASSVTAMNVALTGDGTGDIYYRGVGGALTRLGIGGSGNVLTVSGALLPSWSPLTAGSGTVSPGGSSPQIALYIGASTSTVAPFTMSQDAQISATGALTINSGVVSYAKIQNVAPNRLLGNPSLTTPSAPVEITPGTNLSFIGSTLNAAGSVSSVGMTVPGGSIFSVTPATITSTGTFVLTTTGNSGGIPYFSSTGQLSSSATLAAHGVLLGQGAGVSPTATGPGTVGQVLTSNGPAADPTFQPSASGGGLVNSAAANLVAWYPGPGAAASVGGHPNVTLGAAPGSLAINRNTFTTLPPAVNVTAMQINWADNESGSLLLDTHGTAAPAIVLRAARGPASGPTQSINGDGLGIINFRGYDGTAYTPRVATIQAFARDNYDATHRGGSFAFFTIPAGTFTEQLQLEIGNNGGLVVGVPSAIQASPVAGDINCQRLYINGVSPFADTTTGSITAATGAQGAGALISQLNVVTTVLAGQVVTLPVATVGGHCLVRNSGANTLTVYPASGAQINILGANTAITVLPNSTAYFEASSTTQWFTVP